MEELHKRVQRVLAEERAQHESENKEQSETTEGSGETPCTDPVQENESTVSESEPQAASSLSDKDTSMSSGMVVEKSNDPERKSTDEERGGESCKELADSQDQASENLNTNFTSSVNHDQEDSNKQSEDMKQKNERVERALSQGSSEKEKNDEVKIQDEEKDKDFSK
jgi:hypothetical protein